MKKINNDVKNYILYCIDFVNVNEDYNELSENKQIIKIYAQYRNEWYHLPPTQENFIEWIKGLPTTFNIDYSYNEQKQLLIKWFGNDNDILNRDEIEVSNYFYSVIAEQFFKLYVKASYSYTD